MLRLQHLLQHLEPRSTAESTTWLCGSSMSPPTSGFAWQPCPRSSTGALVNVGRHTVPIGSSDDVLSEDESVATSSSAADSPKCVQLATSASLSRRAAFPALPSPFCPSIGGGRKRRRGAIISIIISWAAARRGAKAPGRSRLRVRWRLPSGRNPFKSHRF